VLRGTKFTPAYIKKFIAKCKSFEDVPYDDQFVLGVKALSCSELVWACDFEERLELSLRDIAGLGREYISPTGISKARNIEYVIDTDNLESSVT
jgi:hypothetical protein